VKRMYLSRLILLFKWGAGDFYGFLLQKFEMPPNIWIYCLFQFYREEIDSQVFFGFVLEFENLSKVKLFEKKWRLAKFQDPFRVISVI